MQFEDTDYPDNIISFDEIKKMSLKRGYLTLNDPVLRRINRILIKIKDEEIAGRLSDTDIADAIRTVKRLQELHVKMADFERKLDGN